MEKYGTKINDLKESLLQEEAKLMEKLSTLGVKTAADRAPVERRLHEVRAKLNQMGGGENADRGSTQDSSG